MRVCKGIQVLGILASLLSHRLVYAGMEDRETKLLFDSYAAETQGKYPQAVEPMVQLLKLSPNDYLTHFRLGWLFYLEKKYKNSVDHYTAARNLAELSLEPILGLVQVYWSAGDYRHLVDTATELLKRDSMNYTGHQRLIQSYLALKEYSNASTSALAALQVYPTDPLFLEQSGFALTQLGKKDEAVKTLKFLLLINPKNEYALAHL